MKAKLLYIPILAGCLVVFYACASSPQTEQSKQAGVFEPLYFEHLDEAAGAVNGTPSLKIRLELLKYPGGGAFEALFNKTLYNGKTPEQYADDIIESRTDEIEAGWKEIEPLDPEESYASYSGEYYETHTAYIYPRIAVVFKELYSYTGGAHGNDEGTSYYVFDLEKQARITLNDILLPGWETALVPLIREALRAYEPISDEGGDKLFFDFDEYTLSVSDDFFYTHQGLGFYYGRGSIAAYAYGPFEPIVPWLRLDKYIKPEAKDVIK